MSLPRGAALMISAICGKIEVCIAGQQASVAFIVALPGAVTLGAAEGERGMSKSSGLTTAGEEDARRRRGDGVGGESESDISSILVHSFPAAGWEAAGRGEFFVLRNARGDKAIVAVLLGGRPAGRFGDGKRGTIPAALARFDGRVGETELDRTTVLPLRGCSGRSGEGADTCSALSSFRGRPTGRLGDCEVGRAIVLSLRGRPTGRFGDAEPALVTEVSLRGRPRPLAGDVFAALSSIEFPLGRPRPRVGEVCAGLSSEESFRGRPRPRLGETIMTGLESKCTTDGWVANLCLSGDPVVVKNGRA